MIKKEAVIPVGANAEYRYLLNTKENLISVTP